MKTIPHPSLLPGWLQLWWGFGTTCFNSAELSEDQLLLLLESLENRIVSQQLKLVREHTSHWAQMKGLGGCVCYFKQSNFYMMTQVAVSQFRVTLGKGKE